MKEILNQAIVHTVDNRIRIDLNGIKEYNELKEYLEVCDFLLEKFIKVAITADSNFMLDFDKTEQTEPSLIDYCIYAETPLKLDKRLWNKIRRIKKKLFTESHKEEY